MEKEEAEERSFRIAMEGDVSVVRPYIEDAFPDAVMVEGGLDCDLLIIVAGEGDISKIVDETSARELVLVVDASIYGREGEMLTEDSPLKPVGMFARGLASAERVATAWAQKDATRRLTVLRVPVVMGKGVGGKTLELFRTAASGRYVHLRGNNTRRSLVMADDVAAAVRGLHGIGGTYNVADGRNPLLSEIATAMAANAGAEKKPITLPASWARVITKCLRALHVHAAPLDYALSEEASRTLTLDNSKARQILGCEFYDTIEVMARRDKTYPYRDI